MVKYIKDIESLISKARLQKYRAFAKENWFEAYKKDIETAKHLYAKLHFLEIFLRNKIDAELSILFGQDWILKTANFPFSEKSLKQLMEIKRGNRDDIISNISFGFWTGIFHKAYHDSLWIPNHTLLQSIFPYLKKHERRVKQIELELDKIRRLRNRVFHFEPLFEMNILEFEALLIKYIKGISGSEDI